jgi:hypothetical protein
VYVNINLVAMDGGWKSTATGLSSYRSLRHHHNVETMEHSRSFMDRHNSELHRSNWRMGEVLRNAGIKVFQIETTMNNDVFGTSGPLAVLQKREWEWSARDRVAVHAMKTGLDRMPARTRRNVFHSWRAPHAMTSVQAGEVEAVHEVTTANVYAQHLVPVEGQTDILTMGLPYIGPYNVNSVMNPILVMCLGLGYFFNLYRGKPLVREGGVIIMSHPTPWDFHPVHHPSYIDFFEQVLADTTDPRVIEERYERQFAEDEWYRHLYRTSHAYHGVHPFYMWYWGAHALSHVGRVIIVGGDRAAWAKVRGEARPQGGRRGWQVAMHEDERRGRGDGGARQRHRGVGKPRGMLERVSCPEQITCPASLDGQPGRGPAGANTRPRDAVTPARLGLQRHDLQAVDRGAASEIGVMVADADQPLAVAGGPQAGLGVVAPLLPEGQGGQHLVIAKTDANVGGNRHLNQRGGQRTRSKAVLEGVLALPATPHDPHPFAIVIEQPPGHGAAVRQGGGEQQGHPLDRCQRPGAIGGAEKNALAPHQLRRHRQGRVAQVVSLHPLTTPLRSA